MTNLVFKKAPLSNPAALVFGEADVPGSYEVEIGGAFAPITVSALAAKTELVAISGAFTPLTVAAAVSKVERVAISGAFAPMTLAATTTFSVGNVSRPLIGAARAAHQVAQHFVVGPTAHHQDGAAMSAGPIMPWQRATRVHANSGDRFQSADKIRTGTTGRHHDANKLRTAYTARHQDGDHRRLGAWGRYQEATGRRRSTLFRHQDGYRDRRIWTRQRHQGADHLPAVRHEHDWQTADTLKAYWLGVYQEAMRPPPGVHPAIPVQPPVVCYLPDPDIVFRSIYVPSLDLVFTCGLAAPPLPTATIVVPIRSVYLVINTVTLVRVDGNVPLDATALSMSIDADSWTWSWSASLAGSALPLIDSEDPVEVEATINGVAYRLFIEQVSRERTFARNSLRVSGRGRNAFLGTNVDTYGDQPLKTAQQLMNHVLTNNGVPLGWDVEFDLEDWLVPANVWSHQGSRISAIRAIAEAAGGYVQPHPTANTLRILPRYPLAPWDWVSADYELPAAVTQREGIEWVNRPAYNRVFVSGTRDGVLGQVTRGGTAGDVLAPMVTDPLITQATAARQRGLAVLGDTGRQASVSLRLPVLPATGLILPGKMVSYVDGGVSRLGIVRSSSLDWNRPQLWQSIGVETHA